MEQSSFSGKLIRPARDATAIKVHSKEVSPDFRMRSIKVFAGGKRTAQTKVFQVIIADGCLFYGNDALRSKGGCCICLLMASGLTAKRFSTWVADADEGEFNYTISSKRFKLTVFIILPRVVYTSHQCASHSKMGDNRSGGHENITKDFLTYAVRHLSRLYVGKTRGQEVFWKNRPPNWPKHLTWKNPTSSTKDSTETLNKKYHCLRSLVPNEKLSQEEQSAFQDFEAGNTDSVKSFMLYDKSKDQMNNLINWLPVLQKPHRMLLDKQLTTLLTTLLKDKISSSSIASTSGSPTAAETSSSTLSKKRKTDRQSKSVQSKKFKTEMPNCGNNIQNSRKQRDILPKPTQTTSSEFLTVLPESRALAQSSAVESPVRYTFTNQTQQSLVSSNNTMSNTRKDTSECTTLPHTETAAAPNSGFHQPSSSTESSNANSFSSAHQLPHCTTKGHALIRQTSDSHCSQNVKDEENPTIVDCGWNAPSRDLIYPVDIGNKSCDSNMTPHIRGTDIVFNNAQLKSPSVQNLLEDICTSSSEIEYGTAP